MQASIFAEIPSQLVVKSIRCQYQRGCHALSPPNQSRCNHASRATFAQPSAHEDFQRITRPTVCGNCLGCCRSVKSSGSWLLSVSIYLSEYVRITRRKSCSLSPREIRLRIFHTARSMRYIILKELDWKNISEKKLSVCAALLATCLPKKKKTQTISWCLHLSNLRRIYWDKYSTAWTCHHQLAAENSASLQDKHRYSSWVWNSGSVSMNPGDKPQGLSNITWY